jgi:hypothetical protein
MYIQIKNKTNFILFFTYNMNDGLLPCSKTHTSKKGEILHRKKQQVGKNNNEQEMNKKQKCWLVFEASTNRHQVA